LQHDADPLAERALAPRRVVAEDAHLARVGGAMPLEDLDERGLAGTVGPEDGEHLAAADVEVDRIERGHRAGVGLAQAADADGRIGRRPGGRRAPGDGHVEVVRDHARQHRRVRPRRHRRAGRT